MNAPQSAIAMATWSHVTEIMIASAGGAKLRDRAPGSPGLWAIWQDGHQVMIILGDATAVAFVEAATSTGVPSLERDRIVRAAARIGCVVTAHIDPPSFNSGEGITQ